MGELLYSPPWRCCCFMRFVQGRNLALVLSAQGNLLLCWLQIVVQVSSGAILSEIHACWFSLDAWCLRQKVEWPEVCYQEDLKESMSTQDVQ
jgi:hypothetical protein